jgi:hypothetical protein
VVFGGYGPTSVRRLLPKTPADDNTERHMNSKPHAQPRPSRFEFFVALIAVTLALMGWQHLEQLTWLAPLAGIFIVLWALEAAARRLHQPAQVAARSHTFKAQ